MLVFQLWWSKNVGVGLFGRWRSVSVAAVLVSVFAVFWVSRVRVLWWLSLQGLGSFFMLSVIPQVPTSSPYGWQYVKVVHQVSYGFAKHLSMKIGL
jgi:hypothetical protein